MRGDGKVKCTCVVCGKEFYQYPSRVKQGIKACSNACRSLRIRGENNYNFVSGYSINQWGYKMINVDGKKVYEHRHIMEQYLGRKLIKGEEVHHINGDKLDNRIENLEVLSIDEHKKHHRNITTGQFVSRVTEVSEQFKERRLF